MGGLGFQDRAKAVEFMRSIQKRPRRNSRLNLGEAVAPSGVCTGPDSSRASRPLECIRRRGQVQIWLASASAEELRAMAKRLLSGGPVSPDEAFLQRQIGLALCASATLSRRLMAAMGESQNPRMRFCGRESSQGSRL